jgi:chromosome segregation ATPase
MSADLEKAVLPLKARNAALAQQRLKKEADDVGEKTDKVIQLAAEKLTAFDRRVETVTSTLANISAEGVRTAREIKKIDQELDAIRKSASKNLGHFQVVDSQNKKDSEVLRRSSNSLKQLSVIIQENEAKLDQVAKEALDLQKKKSFVQSRVDDLISARLLATRLTRTVDSTFSAIAENMENLDLMLRQDQEAAPSKTEAREKLHSRIESNLKETKSKVEATVGLLSQLATAKTVLEDQLSPLSKDASKQWFRISTSEHDLGSTENDLRKLPDEIHGLLVPTTDEIESISTKLRGYGEDVSKQRRLLSASSLSSDEITKRLDGAGRKVLVSSDVLKTARTELSDQLASLTRSQVTAEAVKAKIEDFAREVSDVADLEKLEHVHAATSSPMQIEEKNWKQQNQAMREMDSALASVAGMNQKFKARIEKASSLETELQASGRELVGTRKSLAKRMSAAADLGPTYDQLERYYKTLLEQNKALNRAQRARQERASEMLAKVSSLQDRFPALRPQLKAASIGKEMQSKIASVLPIIANKSIDKQRDQLTRIREKLDALTLAFQSRRTLPTPDLKRDPGISSVPTEPSKEAAAGISKADPKKSQSTAGKISVQCNLSLPSCRKWLFLRTNKLQRNKSKTNVAN